MRTTLRTMQAALFAFALFAAPAFAQEPGGDAPDGTTAAQDAIGATAINGDLEGTADVDCFAIYINDAAIFSATTTNGVSASVDTKLYLWQGDTSGATDAIAFNDDDPDGGVLQSELPPDNALYNSLPEGTYVLCVTSYDNDPLNEVPTDIFPQGSPFNQVYPPAPASGTIVLASWDNPGFGDFGTYQIDLTGVGTPGGGCEQSISATLDDPTPSPGQTITFAVTVSNDAASAATLDLWIDASGPANLRKRLARGTLPAGATVTRNVRVRVPGNAPSGAYAVDLNIGDFGADDICDTASFTVTVSAPRMGAGASDTEWEATVEGDFFAAASATTAGAGVAVAPNPFARQTTISYEVAAASDVRLAVYDVLGREVAVLVDARQEAGTHRATFDASGLAAGTYVYRLVVGSDVQTGRLTLAH